MATILVIEDEDSIYGLLRAALESAGHEVRQAPSGHVGLTMYRENPTDLVITDVFMPEMDGLDLILDLTREFLNTKVIAISGYDGDNDFLHVAKLLGARQVLQKPFSVDSLLSAVRYELTH